MTLDRFEITVPYEQTRAKAKRVSKLMSRQETAEFMAFWLVSKVLQTARSRGIDRPKVKIALKTLSGFWFWVEPEIA